MTNISFRTFLQYVKERLEPHELERLTKPPGLEDKVESILTCLLYDRSMYHYVPWLRKLAPQVPEDGLWLQSLQKDHAEKVLDALHGIWDGLKLPCKFRSYMNRGKITLKKNERAEHHLVWIQTERHDDCMRSLKQHIFKYPNPDVISLMTAATYWLCQFFAKKDYRKHNINKDLWYFLCDLFMWLIVLDCLVTTKKNRPHYFFHLENIGFFPNVTPHICITPENPIFQQLILTRMLDIVGTNWYSHRYETPQVLAELFCSHFKQSRKRTEGVLRIIKDQSRYMSLGSCDMRYVGVKTAGRASQIPNIQKAVEVVTKEWGISYQQCTRQLKEIHAHMKLCGDYHKKEKSKEKKEKKKEISMNILHHYILLCLVGCEYGQNFIGIRNKRMEIKTEDFLALLKDIAYRFIRSRRWDRDRQKLAEAAIALQIMITLRCRENEVKMHAGIRFNRNTQKHQEVVFVLIALRVLVLCLLPAKLGQYGVQPVSPTLPDYAKALKFTLHLHSSNNQ